MNLMTSVVLCLVRKILYLSGRVINEFMSMRLLLGNLKEVYQQFKEKHPMESFCEKLKTSSDPFFIAKQQSAFHMEVKSSLQ